MKDNLNKLFRHLIISNLSLKPGAQKLTGENLKVVLSEFSTLSWAVFVMNTMARRTQARPHLELKTQTSFCPVSLNMSMLLLSVAC